MRIKMTAFAMLLAGCASVASAQQSREQQQAQRESTRPTRVWDPNLAQWRVEHPRRVWDPNLAQYRHESRREVWDPYLAQHRPRDARRDPAPPARQPETRHWHPGRSEGCAERH